jgi:hypothetical protein
MTLETAVYYTVLVSPIQDKIMQAIYSEIVLERL